MDTPRTLQSAIAHFADPQRAFEAAFDFRWPDGKVTCPRCGKASTRLSRLAASGSAMAARSSSPSRWEPSWKIPRLGLDKWMVALWMLANCKNGISSYELGQGSRHPAELRMVHAAPDS